MSRLLFGTGALHLELPHKEVKKVVFPDEEFKIILPEIEEKKVIYINTLKRGEKPSEWFLETLQTLDALSVEGKEIVGIFPYLPFSRQDRVFDKEPITSRIVTNAIKDYLKKVYLFELHSPSLAGFFKSVRHITIKEVFSEKINEIKENAVFVSPDLGGFKRMLKVSGDHPAGAVIKERDKLAKAITKDYIGPIKEKAIVIDDLISSGGTIIKAAEVLKKKGFEEVYVFAMHGLFSKNALERIESCEEIKEVFVSNTLEQKEKGKIKVVKIEKIIKEIWEHEN